MSRGTHQPLCSATFQKSIQYHRCVGCQPACQRRDSSRKQILSANKWRGGKKMGKEMTENIYNVPTNRSAAWRWDKSHLMCAAIRERIIINKRQRVYYWRCAIFTSYNSLLVCSQFKTLFCLQKQQLYLWFYWNVFVWQIKKIVLKKKIITQK